jgi:hypothetical protein
VSIALSLAAVLGSILNSACTDMVPTIALATSAAKAPYPAM